MTSKRQLSASDSEGSSSKEVPWTQTLQFYQFEQFDSAELLLSCEVVARIESHAFIFLEMLVQSGSFMTMEIIPRSRECSTHGPGGEIRIPKDHSFEKRHFAVNPAGYTNMWRSMKFIHEILLKGKKATQRDMYYTLIDTLTHQAQLNRILQDLVAFLHCPRRCLGIIASPRGSVAGCLSILDRSLGTSSKGTWIDCTSADRHGIQIPGDESAIADIRCDARYILVVEKDGVFSRLVEDRIFRAIPCVIVTGKGIPDLATRALVSRIHHQFSIPVLGLCDWNPGGLTVLAAYRQGSIAMALEGARYAVHIKWLGLRSEDIDELDLPQSAYQPQTEHDGKSLDGLVKLPWIDKAYANEVAEMKKRGTKVDCKKDSPA